MREIYTGQLALSGFPLQYEPPPDEYFDYYGAYYPLDASGSRLEPSISVHVWKEDDRESSYTVEIRYSHWK